jgi:flagellar basal body rod protein FlgF
VNAVQAMLRQLDLARQFEAQMKLMTAARDNDDAADRLLRSG